jgi:hypothetical protein
MQDIIASLRKFEPSATETKATKICSIWTPEQKICLESEKLVERKAYHDQFLNFAATGVPSLPANSKKRKNGQSKAGCDLKQEERPRKRLKIDKQVAERMLKTVMIAALTNNVRVAETKGNGTRTFGKN